MHSVKLVDHILYKEMKYFMCEYKNVTILEGYISFQKFIRDYVMYQENLLFRTAVRPQRTLQSFLIIIFSP